MGRGVGTAVVDTDNLNVTQALRAHRVEAFGQILLGIVDSNQYGYLTHDFPSLRFTFDTILFTISLSRLNML